MRSRVRKWIAAGFAFMAALCAQAHAGEVSVAVAANFMAPAKEIAEAFYSETGHTAGLSFGSTGQIYTQITQGAPFDIFLSADAEHPKKAEADGWAVANTRFTYAIGKLVLWSADARLIDNEGVVLKSGRFSYLAIANPAAAPYGAAAVEVIKALGLDNQIEPRLVMSANITQAFQFVASGNAELGFVALSQVVENGAGWGSTWRVPENLYAPILQDAVLLKQGEKNLYAKAFCAFLKSPTAVKIIESYGYGVLPGA